MDYKVVYTKASQRDIARLEKAVAWRILSKVDVYVKGGDPLARAKQLKGFAIATYRFRIGEYRVVFCLDYESNNLVVLVVLRVAHRKDVY